MVYKNHKSGGLGLIHLSQLRPLPFAPVPVATQLGSAGVRPEPGRDPHGVLPGLFLRAATSETESLKVIIQQVSSTDWSNEGVTEKLILDGAFFSSTVLVSKLCSL